MKLRRATRLILRISYFYMKLMGLLHFSYNFASGRVTFTRRNIVFAALSNLYLLVQLPLVRNDSTKMVLRTHANELHLFVYFAMATVRISVALITVALNWWRGRDVLALIRDFESLREEHFARLKVESVQQRRFEKGIWWKFIAITCGDLSISLALIDMCRHMMSFRLFLSLAVISSLSSLLNIVLNFYYFAIILIILHFDMLNEELKRILRQANAASEFKLRRPGVFITLCCQLADDLDVLAIAHLKLQRIAQGVNALFEIHVTLFMASIYFNNLGSSFLFYATLKHQAPSNFSAVGEIFILISMVAYYTDVRLLSFTIMDMLQVANDAANLLQHKWPTLPLDIRLERSLENFALQLSRDPLEMWLLGLYKFEKQILFAACATTVSHLLVLIQYDYKNY